MFSVRLLGVVDHVLDDGREFMRGGVDLGFRLGVEVDGLGVAAAFEIEGAGVGPAVFVVTQQDAVRVGRQRGLAGTGQAEEHGRVLGVALGVVGGAVHRHDAFFGQQVVHQREHGFLVFAGILRVADQDHLALDRHRDDGFGAAAVAFRVGFEGRAVDDRVCRLERVKFGHAGTDEHSAVEQRVPCQLGDHAHVDAIGRIGAGVEVFDEILAALHVGQHVLIQLLEVLGRHRRIVFPPDRVLDRGFVHRELVLGRAAGEFAGFHQQRAAVPQSTFAAAQRGLDQRGLQKIVMG
jgi:hypothetical protein